MTPNQRRKLLSSLFVGFCGGAVILALIPLALVIALSPLSVIPALLAMHAPRPKPTSH